MRRVILLILLFVVAVVAATTLGSNDGLVSIYWGGWRAIFRSISLSSSRSVRVSC